MRRTICCTIIALFIFLSYSIVMAAQQITVCGTGDSQELLRTLAQAFEQANPGITVNVPDSIGSGGGVKATAKGKCELGRVARPIKKKEEKYNLGYKVFAKSPVVFVVNKSVQGVDNLTAEQIKGIYSGIINLWSEVGGEEKNIYVVHREADDSSRSVLEKKLPGFKNIKSFTGKIIYSTPETVETILKYKETIGYTALSIVTGTDLKVLKVDGVYPSAENVNKGSYNLVSPFGIIWKGELSGLSRKFFEFLFSPEAGKIISDNGVIPVK
jgi:phosphate transport system substrate-binding protein